MNQRKLFFQSKIFRLGLCAVALVTFTGCVARLDGPRVGVYAEPEVFVAQDDYVYYPQYECYYSVSRHQYAYREGNNWVARSAPREVSVKVLTASPSVRMDFHDSTAQHHATVAKQYPKNWKPAGSKPEENRKDDQRGEGNGK